MASIPIVEDLAEVYAKKYGINLTEYDRHTVIFEFPSNLNSLVDEILSKVKLGLIATAPKETLAIVECRFSVQPGESEDNFVNIAHGIALVRKSDYYVN